MTVAPFPGANVPVLAQGTNFFAYAWLTYLQGLSSQPGAPQTITIGASPLSFTAAGSGSLAVNGGTVSAKTLTRGGTTVSISANMIPVANNDVVTVTYSAAPSLVFIPN